MAQVPWVLQQHCSHKVRRRRTAIPAKSPGRFRVIFNSACLQLQFAGNGRMLSSRISTHNKSFITKAKVNVRDECEVRDLMQNMVAIRRELDEKFDVTD
jgi:hypothetical protein